MYQKEIKRFLIIFGKICLSILVYLFFMIYTPTVYMVSKSFMADSFFDSKVLMVGQSKINVKIANSEIERIQGLSGRKNLKDDEGMFFEFEKDGQHGIWMKDMNFSIDIIWFDKYGAIIYVEKNIDPKTYPKVFKPEIDARYVLEVNSGFFDKNNLEVGDTIDLY
jgi:uncharacterized membrane protein (UPF0127 family)